MVELLAMTSGASLLGIWVYRRQEKRAMRRSERDAAPGWWQTAWQRLRVTGWSASRPVAPARPAPAPPVAESSLAPPPAAANPAASSTHAARPALLALAVTTTGRLLYPPLQLAGVPVLVYMGVPAAQQAYDQLIEEGRPGRALVETAVLVVCLAGGYFWVGSLCFSLYHTGRQLWVGQPLNADVHPVPGLAPATTHLRKAGIICTVPTATLQPGDQVILRSGELAPTDGLITEGVAWLRPQALAAANALRKGVGDRITAADLVVVGEIGVRVLSA